jgi:hypothetical protein
VLYVTKESYGRIVRGQFDSYPLWLREVVHRPSTVDFPRMLFWQYAGNGRVPGIAGRVDLNAFVGRQDDFRALSAPGPVGVHTATELADAARKIVGFLRGQVSFDEIQLAGEVKFRLGREGGGTEVELSRATLRDSARWRVRSDGGVVYDLAPSRRACPGVMCLDDRALLTTRVGRHLNCMERSLGADFEALAQLPHVGTSLLPAHDDASCLQSWNMTLVFDPRARPPTLVAAVYDQWEW